MSTGTSSFSTYNLRGMIPHSGWGWDEYSNRLSRYDVYQQYYNNIMYHRIVNFAETLKASERLYKHARGVYNPVFRLVELYVAKIAGGGLDYKDPSNSAAFPIDTANEALLPAIARLWRDSRWQQKKSLYVRNGGKVGDSFLKVVDDVKRQQVRLEVLDPTCVRFMEKDETGAIAKIAIEYYVPDPLNSSKWVTYTEVITPERYQTYREGVLFAYYQNLLGDPIAEWDNDYGFVPVFHAMHRDVGMVWGANPYYASIQKVNELNDLASIVNDGGRNQVRFPVAIAGAKAQSEVSFGSASNETPSRDALNALFLPEKATITPIQPNISLADGLQAIDGVLKELERDFPELALHRIREGGNLTAPGVSAAYSDAVAQIQEAMANYDATLVEAQRAALAIGGMRGYTPYQGLGLTSLLDDTLDHNIKLRPIIDDTLGKAERINLILQSAESVAGRILLGELGLNETEIGEVLANVDAKFGFYSALDMPRPPIQVTPQQASQAQAGAELRLTDIVKMIDGGKP